MRPQPVLGHARQEAHALALGALEQSLSGVVGGDARVRPRQGFLCRRPPVLRCRVRSGRKVRLHINCTLALYGGSAVPRNKNGQQKG